MKAGDLRLLGWLAGVTLPFAALVAAYLPGMVIECFKVSL